MPVVGFLAHYAAVPFAHLVVAFRQGLSEVGFVEGQNVAIEQRWAEGQDDRLPALVADLMRRKATVIVTNTPAALVAKAAGNDHTDRLRDRQRPGQRWPRRQPQPARRQPHRRGLYHQRAGGEAAGIVASARAQGDDDRHARESEHP